MTLRRLHALELSDAIVDDLDHQGVVSFNSLPSGDPNVCGFGMAQYICECFQSSCDVGPQKHSGGLGDPNLSSLFSDPNFRHRAEERIVDGPLAVLVRDIFNM